MKYPPVLFYPCFLFLLIYYFSHVEKNTQFENPVLEAKKKLRSGKTQEDEKSDLKILNDQPGEYDVHNVLKSHKLKSF